MRRPARAILAIAVLSLASLALLTIARSSRAAAVFFNSAAAFNSIVTVINPPVTFEGQPEGPLSSPYTEALCTFSAVGLAVLTPATGAPTNPMPTSHVLTSSGPDGMSITFPPIVGPTNVSFETITNRFAPPVVTVYYQESGLVAGTYTLTQPPNSFGFVGIIADQSIGRVQWQSTSSDIERACIDNVRIGNYVVPVRPTTWGRLHALYR